MKAILIVLFIIQWLSITLVILNLDTQEFVTGAFSLFTAFILFIVFAQRFLSNSSYSKALLSLQIVISVLILSLWTTSCVLANHGESSYNKPRLLTAFLDSTLDKIRITTFVTITFWFILLLVSLVHLFRFSVLDPVPDITVDDKNQELIIKALHIPLPPPSRPPVVKRKEKAPQWDLGIDFEPVTLDLRLYNDLIN
ncbi:hypothetical protein G6F56_010162 [Rhizopus delemar]|nr:hypothetical protein G6F56_010162 [Rhizopus delemar]